MYCIHVCGDCAVTNIKLNSKQIRPDHAISDNICKPNQAANVNQHKPSRHQHPATTMAFIAPLMVTRATPVCASRNSSQRRPRRGKPGRAATRKPDPILDDRDVDMTDITTYVSCPTCFNSIMLRPQQLARGSMRVTCNCCGKPSSASLHVLENMDGTPFDYKNCKFR